MLGVPTLVGSASGTGVSSLDVTLTEDVPASTPDTASVLFICMQLTSPFASIAGPSSYSDNAPATSARYSGPNGVPESGGGLLLGLNPLISPPIPTDPWPEMFGQLYVVTEALTAGDVVTIPFSGPVNYVRCSLVAFEGFGDWGGSCSADEVFITNGRASAPETVAFGGSAGGLNETINGSDLPDFYEIGLYMAGQMDAASGGLAWVDPDVVTVDSWTDQGPDEVSALIGYRVLGPFTGATNFDTGATATSPGGQQFVCSVFVKTGTGIAYCASVSGPSFNRVIPV